MRNRFVCSVLACALSVVANAIAQQPPPATAFASLPEMAMVCLTPDGQKVAWANDPGGKPIVVVFDLATGRDLRRMALGDYAIRGLDWADDRTLLMTISTTRKIDESMVSERQYEFFRVLAVDAGGGGLRSMLLGDPEKQAVTSASVVRLHTGKPETILMSSFDFDQTAFRSQAGSRLSGGRKDQGWLISLFEVSTRTGTGKKIETGTPHVRDWVVDPQGRPVARSEWNSEQRDFTILAKDGRSWKRIYDSRGSVEFRLQAISADGKSIVATGSRGGDRVKIWNIPLDGSAISLAFEHPQYDVLHTVDDRFTGTPIGYQIGGPEHTIVWVNPRDEELQAKVSRAFPNLRTTVFDRSGDYKRVLVSAEYASSPPVIYLVDLAKGTADIVGEAYPKLANAKLGELEISSYKARDGVSIPAYVTMPPDREAKNLPLVVLPHGGPHSRDDVGFGWKAQFLATRGYVVLQPQFRGSAGFSAALQRAGERQWGRAMQDDITDGVRHLIDLGVVDPKRVCIVGSSYGGYAALAGVAFTPGLYACAVSINGVSDIPNLIGFVRRQYGDDSDTVQFLKDTIGNPTDEDVAKFSPARAINSIRAPILLIYGTSDTVVPPDQSKNFARLMREHGRPIQVMELPGEDHWLSTSESRLKILQTMDAFLATYLKP